MAGGVTSSYDVTTNETGSNVIGLTSGYSVAETVVIGLILVLLIVVTVGGNLLVCVTISTDRKLRTATNYFLLSLAVTDLLLGCSVLPVSAFATLNGDRAWTLGGAAFCNVYISTDVMLCTASILILFTISLDRYFAICQPFLYHDTVSVRLVWKLNAGVWLFSAFVGFAPIHAGWNTVDGSVQNWAQPDKCVFQLNIVYVLVIAGGTYFLPLAVMCTVYFKILRVSRRQVHVIWLLEVSMDLRFAPCGFGTFVE